MRHFVLALLLASGCAGDQCYSRRVEGKITDKGERQKGGGETAIQEKIALVLSPYKADAKVIEVADGADGLTVECLSTRCAPLTVGKCVALACQWVARWNEPDVIVCLHERTITCPDGW